MPRTTKPITDAFAPLTDKTLQCAPFAVAWFDYHGQLLHCNEHFLEQIPGDGNDATVHINQLFVTLTLARWSKLLQQLKSQSPLVVYEILGADRVDGKTVELTLQSVINGEEDIIVLYMRDLRKQQQAEGIQLLQHEVLEAVALGRPLKTLMELICTRVEALAPEVICTVLLVDRQGFVHPCAAPSMPSIFSEAIDGEPIGPQAGSCGTAAYRGEPVEVTDIANDPLWQEYKALALPLGLAACWSSPIKTRANRVVGTFALYYRSVRGASSFHRKMVKACVHLCSLAIEHEESEQQIHQLAFYDPLTGVANRNLLRDRAKQALNHVSQTGEPLAVLFIDLDRFKNINDSMGHSVGDNLLKTIAIRLQRCLTSSDTIARQGGDEFVILLNNSNAERAGRIAERMLRAITLPINLEQVEFSASASIGISMAPDDSLDFETLQKNSDIAMYQAKADGRNTYRFFHQQMNEKAIERMEMESALRKAIADNALEVYYQPQISIQHNNLYGVEALIRWQHPVWGQVSPAVFIPIAEESGLISAIDQWVLNKACQQMQLWRAQGYCIPHVAVNMSAIDLLYAEIPDLVKSLMQQYQLTAGSITLEITEGLMLQSAQDTKTTLQTLRALGTNLSVDDFGTGYSSLSYIKSFPVSELKLDKSFVNDIVDDEDDCALANAIVQLGRILALDVVAEGVETEQQLAILAQQGCPIVQGYYFAKPMPVAQLNSWLDAHADTLATRNKN